MVFYTGELLVQHSDGLLVAGGGVVGGGQVSVDGRRLGFCFSSDLLLLSLLLLLLLLFCGVIRRMTVDIGLGSCRIRRECSERVAW